MRVTKRDGKLEDFDINKIRIAIVKAMKAHYGYANTDIADEVAVRIKENATDEMTIAQIEEQVFELLTEYDLPLVAREYEAYRAIRAYQRERHEVDNKIIGIVDGTNKATLTENSNKNEKILSTQRDLIAGEVSKDIARRMIFPTHLIQAHDQGVIHIHDMDYAIQDMFNCCLINLEDMLQNGTVINGKMIEKPKSFRTACTITTQIVQQVANGQYGGQTISIAHLAPFVRVSYEKHLKTAIQHLEELERSDIKLADDTKMLHASWMAHQALLKEIRDGIQTIQYQINTFSSSNGQAPFLSISLYINENEEYKDETNMIIQEVLRQRIEGIKNSSGNWVTPAFPKLIYVTDENNIYPDSEYYETTVLASKCVTKRMMPDFLSAKKMKEMYGYVIEPMGCRATLSSKYDENGNPMKFGRFNQGVVTINLVDVALTSKTTNSPFFNVLEERLLLVKEALMIRHERLKKVKAGVSPIHWRHGAITRLESDDSSIEPFLYDGYSTITLGYMGVAETVLAYTGKDITSEEGQEFALTLMQYLNETAQNWKEETNIGFSLYGTPAESTVEKFANSLVDRFGIIPGVTGKGYITNSHHVPVELDIKPFDKLKIESQFQDLATGGSISYVEAGSLKDNHEAVLQIMQFMYENIKYAEINTKLDVCNQCNFEGEILINEEREWYCPECGNKDEEKMNVVRRTCGYIGDNYWNKGRTEEIASRVTHVDNKDE